MLNIKQLPQGLKNIVAMNYLKSLIKSDTGDSSKSFFLVMVTIIGFLLLLIVGFVMVYSVVTTGMVATDLYGLAAIIGAVTTLFGAAGLCKVMGERNENRYYDSQGYGSMNRRITNGYGSTSSSYRTSRTTTTYGSRRTNVTTPGAIGDSLLNRRNNRTTASQREEAPVKDDEGSVFDGDFSNDDD